MTEETIYEGVTIHIPRGTVLSASKGNFVFDSPLTGESYTCNKVEYRGNGCWLVIGNKTKVDCKKLPKNNDDENQEETS